MEGELEVLLAHHDASPLSSQATRDFIAGEFKVHKLLYAKGLPDILWHVIGF
jgi:hypothetical protein